MSTSLTKPTPYDREAMEEIAEFKHPNDGWVSRIADGLFKPIDKLGEAAFDTTVGKAAEKALTTVVEKLSDGAAWTVREEAVLAAFRDAGHTVETFADIHDLELEVVEDVMGNIGRKYRVIAAIEGTVVGAAGAAGIAVDVPLVLGIAMRGVAEVAAYYGFYPFTEREKTFALDIISTASSPTQSVRKKNLEELAIFGSEIDSGRRKEAETVLTMQFVEQVAEALVARVAQGKLGQAIPIVGGLIGGGFNRWFLAQVMEMASNTYRERFLTRRYGPEVEPLMRPAAI